jgi:hypothetical protein
VDAAETDAAHRLSKAAADAEARIAAADSAQEREQRIREKADKAREEAERRVREAERRLAEVLGKLERTGS